jgi:hypothetical protein
MRSRTLSIAASLLLVATGATAQTDGHVPHLDLEMTSEEYRALTEHLGELESDDPLTTILNIGKRNLDWLEYINAARPDDQKLALSSAATQNGFPIAAPTIANRTIISQQWDEAKAALPAFIKNIVVDGGSFVRDLPMTDDEFLVHLRIVDRAYQRASRWLLQEPYMDYYTQSAWKDVRGYYHLQREPDLLTKLNNWTSLAAADKARLKPLLISQCRNMELTYEECETEFNGAVSGGLLRVFHTRYQPIAAEHWNTFFKIPTSRTDVTWTAENPNLATIPFRNPQNDAVLAWLRDNIQDEWKWGTWALQLVFHDQGDDDMTHIVFEPGATPHVNRIAGSEITMDGNRSISEYSSRWTIRHEYGHVLGFPDCYLEFFDAQAGVMIQYQLDITDLMCSRRGALKQTHYDEMKRVYFTE